MKTLHEAPVATVINFSAREQIAISDPNENIGPQPEAGVGSRDF